MQRKDYIFWVALPANIYNLGMLEEATGLAEPLLDLRYGRASYKRFILSEAVQRDLADLTVFFDCNDIALCNLLLKALPAESRVVLVSVNQYSANIESLLNEFKKRNVVTGIEVDNRNDANQAIALGTDFLVASGNEAYGPVSTKTSLILIQELLENLDIPLVIRGSLGPQGAAAALAAGCSGCILDSQLLLLKDCGLSDELKESLRNVSPSDTATIGNLLNRPYRFLFKGSHEEYRQLLDQEKKVFLQDISWEEKTVSFEQALGKAMLQGFREEAMVLPVGQGIVFAQQFAEKNLGVREVLKIYQSALNNSISAVKTDFPFLPNSRLAQFHKVKYPIVQGPMACITDNPRLAQDVAEAGALPFVATAGLSLEESRRLLSETRFALGGHPFGVGILCFSSSAESTALIEALLTDPPAFITIAGGDSNLIRRFEQAGVNVYIHAPTLTHIKNFLDEKVRGIILEGHEAGGHIGSLGSLVLWELGVAELMRRNLDELSSMRLILAGGIANARGAFAAAALVSPLVEQGVAVGLQIGTAYLLTDEAVASGAIPAKYQKMLLSGNNTAITGQTVNLPARWLLTLAINKMIETELELERQNLPLPERKRQIEEFNISHLRGALIDTQEKSEEAREKDSSATDAYMCGQMISLQSKSRRIIELHEELTLGSQKLAQNCPIPEMAWEVTEDAIAIIGMGCIFPNANNPLEYWKNILNRHCAIREVPKERWDPNWFYHPDHHNLDYKSYSKIGAYITGFKKNPLKFHIPPVSAPFIELTQFLMLEVAYQALEDVGYLEKKFPRDRTAVFVGVGGTGEMMIKHVVRAHWIQYAESLKSVKEFAELPQELKESILNKSKKIFTQDLPDLSEDSCGGVIHNIIASRINNCFNLGGPGFTINAACASSLAAVDVGIRGLREKRFDLVLAGAVDDRLDIMTYILFSCMGAISAKGSFPFDERADGFVLGEGAGMILLKRLDDAVRDGDKIYAVIREIGTSSDGRAKGITAPDVQGQIRGLESTYEKLSFAPDTISLIEAHGTGTWLGDITEITALTQLIRRYIDKKRFIGLGSVKSMIGHLKGSAGIASIIKVALALHNQILPPTINCEQPRRDFDWENSPFYLITEPRPWKAGYLPRRAAVDSFGFGGINYHMIMEEAPPKDSLISKVISDSDEHDKFPAELLIFRASTRKKLLELVMSTKDELSRRGPSDIHQIATDLLEAGSLTGPTLAVVAADVDELIVHLNKSCEVLRDESQTEFSAAQGIYFGQVPLGKDEKVAFLFPGQGSQYLNMGGDLVTHFPFIKEIFRKIDLISSKNIGFSIFEVLISDEEASAEEKTRLRDLLIRTDYNHPAIAAISASILQILERANIRPDMVAGHSLGEYLALYAAGTFDMQTLIDVINTRGVGIFKHCPHNGAMASVGASAEMLQDILKETAGFVAVANKNCPSQTVISGDVRAIESVVACLDKKGISCQRLPVANAFHSQIINPCTEPFREFLNGFKVNPPRVPVQSNVMGRAYEVDENFSIRLREVLVEQLIRPVEFIDNILAMYKDGARLFIEVGPGSLLSSFVDNILVDKPHWTIPTNMQRRSATLQLLHAFAFCAARGLPVDMKGIISSLLRKRGKLRRTVRSRTASSLLKRQCQTPPADKMGPSNMPNLLSEALLGQNGEVMKKYLAQRGSFLADMIRLDFQHFTGIASAKAEEKTTEDDGLETKIKEFISRKTGYPPDVINIDLDVEAELGLDSIKQVEIMRDIAKELNIDFGDDPRFQRYKITTPRKLIDLCRNLMSKKTAAKEHDVSGQAPKIQNQEREKDWKTNCYRWVCEKIEVPLSGKKDLAKLKNKHILLLVREGSLGSLLKECLKKAGAIVSVASPVTFAENLSENIDLALDCWSYGEDEVPSPKNIEGWWQETTNRSRALLKIAKRVVDSIRDDKNKEILWVEVTSLGGELGAEAVNLVSARAGIGLGISRCLMAEFPTKLKGLYLDFDPHQPLRRVAERVVDELMHQRQHIEIGYAKERRFEIHWKVNEQSNNRKKLQLDSQSVVLAIGGARGITASICRELAERSRSQFIIVGRRPVPISDNAQLSEPITFDAARDTLLEEVRTQGKHIVPAELDRLAWQEVWKAERSWNMNYLRNIAEKVVYRQCDITDAENVRKLIHEVRQKYGRIDLVIQGASDLIEKSTADIDASEFIENMKSKALGTACLLAALSKLEVGAFVNLSSVAGRWGNKGQASYAAGHEVAALLVAGMRGKRSGKWLNIFFGPWLNMGMIRIGPVMERLRARGSDFIAGKAGNEFFIKEFRGGLSHNVAFFGKEYLRISQGQALRTAAATPSAPLLDGVDVIAPGIAQGRRVFDLKRDRFVAEHFVYYDYPIMPGVVSLEMIAQTAFLLADPQFSVTDIEDVVFPHPGIFPRLEPREFYTRARLLSKEETGVWFVGEIFSLFMPPGSTQPKEMLHARCKIRFGHRKIAQKPSLPVVSTGLGLCRVEAKPLFDTKARRHRIGMFQNVLSLHSVTRDGVVGEVMAEEVKEFGKPPKLDNPIRLDGFMEIFNFSSTVFWGAALYVVESIKSIKFFSSNDPEQMRFCRSRFREKTKAYVIFDVEAMNSIGEVVERVNGVKETVGAEKPDSLTESIWNSLRENPRQAEIRRLLAYNDKLALAQINISLVEGALEADEEGLLREQLTAQEIDIYHSLKYSKRRLEWLAGRIIAKGAVRIYLNDDDAPFASAISIQSLPDKAPSIVIGGGAQAVTPLPYISISHSKDIAVAVAAQTKGVGIDVEEVNESILEIIDQFTAEEECKLVESCMRSNVRMITLTAIWAMKEASRKAIGTEVCSMKDLALNKAKAQGDYLVGELYHPKVGHIKSVAFSQDNKYVYAVSISLRQ